MKPFEYIETLSTGRNPTIYADNDGKGYSPFLAARAFSNFTDTLALAAQVNRTKLTPEQHFMLLLSTVRKRKRYTKWRKPEVDASLQAVMNHYRCRADVARQYLRLLPHDFVADLMAGEDASSRSGGD